MGGAKRYLSHHEVSLKAPVLAAARILQEHIAVLARDGVEAYASAIRRDADDNASQDVTKRIIEAAAQALEAA